MKKTLFFVILLCLPIAAKAADYEWSNAEEIHTLLPAHFGSDFHFNFEKFTGAHLPEVIGKAVLKFGVMEHWQMNLELREDFVFYANSIALVNQVDLMRPEDSLYDLTVSAFFRYRFLIDHHNEFSGKVVVNRGFYNDRLLVSGNMFMEAFNTPDWSYGAAISTMLRPAANWTIGTEEQLRLDTEKSNFNILVGGVTHFNIRTDPIPIYYMYRKSRVWKSGKAIQSVDADLRFMKGMTAAAPNWLLGIGLSLTL